MFWHKPNAASKFWRKVTSPNIVFSQYAPGVLLMTCYIPNGIIRRKIEKILEGWGALGEERCCQPPGLCLCLHWEQHQQKALRSRGQFLSKQKYCETFAKIWPSNQLAISRDEPWRRFGRLCYYYRAGLAGFRAQIVSVGGDRWERDKGKGKFTW